MKIRIHPYYYYFFLTNTVVVIFFNMLLPDYVVLGNSNSNRFLALIFCAGFITFAVSLINEIMIYLKLHFKNELTKTAVFASFYAGIIWLLSRFSETTGLGISSFVWAIIIGLSMNLFSEGIKILMRKTG